jgi:hypothetical protein
VNKLKLLMVTLFCFMSTEILPFISYNLLYKDGKLVLILGDCHIEQFDQVNKQHVQFLIEHLKESAVKKKINCFLEITADTFAKFQDLGAGASQANEKTHLCATFSELCSYGLNNNNFEFYPVEPRGDESSDVQGLLSTIASLLGADVYDEKQMASKQLFNFKGFKSVFLYDIKNRPMTLDQYYKIINSNYEKTREVVEKYQETPFYSVLKEHSQKYLNTIMQTMQLFKHENKNKRLVEAIIDLFANLNSKFTKEVFNNLSKINTILNGDYLMADLFFIDSILQDQIENSKTAFILGEAHAVAVAKMLTSIGYESVCAFTGVKYLDGYESKCIYPNLLVKILTLISLINNLPDEGLDEQPFEEIQKYFLANLSYLDSTSDKQSAASSSCASSSSAMPYAAAATAACEPNNEDMSVYLAQMVCAKIDEKIAQQTQSDIIPCNACKKDLSQEQSKLRCSRCQNAYYCNGVCQKSDWKKTHKKSCKAAK